MRLQGSLLLLLLSLFASTSYSQGFLHTDEKEIVDGENRPIILRGMGLGGWMLQEGYMLQTAGFANAQHQLRERIELLIGKDDTDAFYDAWLTNHVQKADIDSLKAWGFNSVRLPMHYNLFTLPIEDEPVQGENTWLTKGFELTDQLIEWCRQNKMYVILDLHAAPGGQGYDEGISDYDSDKPSLWESKLNQEKTVALWKRIAERYADEPWIAGYDLINEPNWNLNENQELRELYENITAVIREVDQNHIIFIEGNWFANDFTGLTPPWDDNMVYSPHKYWSINDVNSIQWVLTIRDNFNIPLYLGESGENSNLWFRDAIKLFEDNNIGWAWWPMKKVESIAGPLSWDKSEKYQALLDYWNGTGSQPSTEEVKGALMDLAEGMKMENLNFHPDVIDAMFRQVQSNEPIPYTIQRIPGTLYPSDFDIGLNGIAYSDNEVANYQVSTGTYTSWNNGWIYRNDGVDLEKSTDDTFTNGINVGWIDKDEWMQYSIDVAEPGVYEAEVRVSSISEDGRFHFAIGDTPISEIVTTVNSEGWQNWESVIVENIVLEEADNKIIFYTDAAGFNLGGINFRRIGKTSDINTTYLSAETLSEQTIIVHINKNLDQETELMGFEIEINGESVSLTDLEYSGNRSVMLSLTNNFSASDVITVSYNGNSIMSTDGNLLTSFNKMPVSNSIAAVTQIPGRVEAESYFFAQGIQLESTTDTGGGQNIGYLDIGDYADYYIDIPETGSYIVNYRTAAESETGAVIMELIEENGAVRQIHKVSFAPTGNWQSWTTTRAVANLQAGIKHIRIRIDAPLFNLNWFEFLPQTITSTEKDIRSGSLRVFPNPTNGQFIIQLQLKSPENIALSLSDLMGREVWKKEQDAQLRVEEIISTEGLQRGIYILQLRGSNGTMATRRILIK